MEVNHECDFVFSRCVLRAALLVLLQAQLFFKGDLILERCVSGATLSMFHFTQLKC